MKKYLFYSLAALAGVATTTLAVAGLASAQWGQLGDFGPSSQGPSSEYHEQMQAIMDSGDYDAWSEQMMSKVNNIRSRADQLQSATTRENFDLKRQVHQLMADGQFDEARKLIQESDLQWFGRGMGAMGMRHNMFKLNNSN